MEEIIYKIVQIDNRAKSIINEQREKEKNMDDYIEQEFQKQKSILDLEYREAIEKENRKYKELINEKKQQMDVIVMKELEEIEKHYQEQENKMIHHIINCIQYKEESVDV